jgi:hypothetical protein
MPIQQNSLASEIRAYIARFPLVVAVPEPKDKEPKEQEEQKKKDDTVDRSKPTATTKKTRATTTQKTTTTTTTKFKGATATPSGSLRQHHQYLTVPKMRKYIKDAFDTKARGLTYEQWLATLQELYDTEPTTSCVEEIFMAGLLLAQHDKFRARLPLAILYEWIGNLHGWAEVDITCQSTFSGKEVAARWDKDFASFVTHDLVESTNPSHRRASLVLLLRTLRESSDERFLQAALQNIDRLSSRQKKEKKKTTTTIIDVDDNKDNDIMDQDKGIIITTTNNSNNNNQRIITKAISWTLRTALQQHRERIHAYVKKKANQLPRIAVIEFRNKYTTGKKAKKGTTTTTTTEQNKSWVM